MTEENGQEQDWQEQVEKLRSELSQLRTNNQAIWYLLVQIGNRLQRASTSVKTAVSSLMDYDIFWDETTQYEFLQAIDSSTDELADLIVLMTLAFRSQAKALEIETESNMIQEILVTVQNNFAKNERDVKIVTNYPPDGSPVLVDYQYLSVALGLLIEAIIGEDKDVTQLFMQATESTECWQLQIDDLKPSMISILHQLFEQPNDISLIVNQILPENALKLITACRILYLQNIELCQQEPIENLTALCLSIPIATNLASTYQL